MLCAAWVTDYYIYNITLLQWEKMWSCHLSILFLSPANIWMWWMQHSELKYTNVAFATYQHFVPKNFNFVIWEFIHTFSLRCDTASADTHKNGSSFFICIIFEAKSYEAWSGVCVAEPEKKYKKINKKIKWIRFPGAAKRVYFTNLYPTHWWQRYRAACKKKECVFKVDCKCWKNMETFMYFSSTSDRTQHPTIQQHSTGQDCDDHEM